MGLGDTGDFYLERQRQLDKTIFLYRHGIHSITILTVILYENFLK